MMRRVGLLIAPLVLVGCVALLLSPRDGRSAYRIAAVFDTAKGMVAGQQVKIAGAVVGKVEEVELAPGPKARMVLSIDRRFSPFGADATCKILPEGLISENYVECDPGRSVRGSLSAGPGGLPTVGVRSTAVPVSLQDFLNVFTMPTNQRLRVLLNELGIATAGRGADLNAILRRANPALSQSRRVLSLIADQRRQLVAAVGQTDTVIAELADRDRDVRTFVASAAAVAGTTARHRAALGESVRRLPAMLDAVRPGLRSLDRAAASASPLLAHLKAAAPALARLETTLPSFTRAGTPAVRAVASAARTGRPDVRVARPTIKRLRAAMVPVKPFARDLSKLLINTRDRGGIEGIMKFLYSFANVSALYDGTSHVLTFNILAAANCLAAEKNGEDPAGCSHKHSAPGQGSIPVNNPDCGPWSNEKIWQGRRCGTGFPPARARDKKRADRGPARPQVERLSDAVKPLVPKRALPVRPPAATKRDNQLPIPESVEALLDYLLL